MTAIALAATPSPSMIPARNYKFEEAVAEVGLNSKLWRVGKMMVIVPRWYTAT